MACSTWHSTSLDCTALFPRRLLGTMHHSCCPVLLVWDRATTPCTHLPTHALPEHQEPRLHATPYPREPQGRACRGPHAMLRTPTRVVEGPSVPMRLSRIFSSTAAAMSARICRRSFARVVTMAASTRSRTIWQSPGGQRSHGSCSLPQCVTAGERGIGYPSGEVGVANVISTWSTSRPWKPTSVNLVASTCCPADESSKKPCTCNARRHIKLCAAHSAGWPHTLPSPKRPSLPSDVLQQPRHGREKEGEGHLEAILATVAIIDTGKGPRKATIAAARCSVERQAPAGQ